MLTRTFVILSAFWSLMAMPALCEGGVLRHECRQHESRDCKHEGDCHDDPCAQFTSTGVQKYQVDAPELEHQSAAALIPIPTVPPAVDTVFAAAHQDLTRGTFAEPTVSLPLTI